MIHCITNFTALILVTIILKIPGEKDIISKDIRYTGVRTTSGRHTFGVGLKLPSKALYEIYVCFYDGLCYARLLTLTLLVGHSLSLMHALSMLRHLMNALNNYMLKHQRQTIT